MTDVGFREKVIARLEELGMKRQELAVRAGISKSYIYKLLMDGPGNRENPRPDVKQRIAAVLGLTLADLDDSHDLTTLLITSLYELPPSKRRELASGTPNDRLLAIVEIMKKASPEANDDEISASLGLPTETYHRIIEGSPIDTAVMNTLAERTGLSIRFWLRGRLDPNPRLVNLLLESDQVADILEIAEQIITRKVSAEVVRSVVEAMARGGV